MGCVWRLCVLCVLCVAAVLLLGNHALGGEGECVGCKGLVTLLENFVTENTTEQELFALVDKICPFLDPQIASVCPAMVEQMGPIVLQALVERENPEVLCTQLKFCDKKNSTRVEPHLEVVEVNFGGRQGLLRGHRTLNHQPKDLSSVVISNS